MVLACCEAIRFFCFFCRFSVLLSFPSFEEESRGGCFRLSFRCFFVLCSFRRGRKLQFDGFSCARFGILVNRMGWFLFWACCVDPPAWCRLCWCAPVLWLARFGVLLWPALLSSVVHGACIDPEMGGGGRRSQSSPVFVICRHRPCSKHRRTTFEIISIWVLGPVSYTHLTLPTKA